MKNNTQINDEQALSLQAADILCALAEQPFVNQRTLSKTMGQSLGVVNRSLKELYEASYLDEATRLTERAWALLNARRPYNAVILAAGVGMRMVPINHSAPKALLEVRGERLIERTIRQLRAAGIEDITVVVGFMKESFEYLIDDFGVNLRVSRDYATTNSLYSLGLALDRLNNTYIIPCDLWFAANPYRRQELYSWYMVTDRPDVASDVRVNRKRELVRVSENTRGNRMVGIAYLTGMDAEMLKTRVRGMIQSGRHDGDFWEAALYDGDRMRIPARTVRDADVVEINTYEQLREFDSGSDHLKSDALRVIAEALDCAESDIRDIVVLKKGMTNHSFRFAVRGQRYIMRIPGEGTDRLIDRKQEAAAFAAIRGLGLCDDPVYLNPENGYKITRYLDGVRVCDAESIDDIVRCMKMLRDFHALRLTVGHTFDIFGQIDYYESLWEGTPSAFRDYAQTKANVLRLWPYIDTQPKDWCLTHIDAVPDNFLFYKPDGGGEERLQLTDWEYAGMQDPHVDIAMFCVYSLYDRVGCDRVIDIYFEGQCDRPTRAKIYAYIAACGLLWSNWCEYKRKLGMEFGEYSLRQYRYAKDFYKYATALMGEAHTVKRAIIMAAGTGVRMRPLTLTTPKPLIRVNGVRMIDTVIQGLRENGITEIYVVVGHLKEQFNNLPQEYPGLQLIENPWYDTCNNISSLYVARAHLEDCMILDGDQIVYNPAILDPHFTRSGYNAVWREDWTNEWMMDVEDGVVKRCSRDGGARGWQLYSISRWTAEDGAKLRRHLEREFEGGNRQIYWDDVAMFCHFNEYRLGIREMRAADVVEIDDLTELARVDQSYAGLVEG